MNFVFHWPGFSGVLRLLKWLRLGMPSPPPPWIKRQIILQYAKKHRLRYLVETGTSFGDTVEALKTRFDRVYSIELSKQLYLEACKRFRPDAHVSILQGDSATVLSEIIPQLKGPALFWLDAHYSGGGLRGSLSARGTKDTPILDELSRILESREKRHGQVVLIDDIRLFGTDPEYPSLGEIHALLERHSCTYRSRISHDVMSIELS